MKFMRMQRLMFGGKSSPYQAVQGHTRGKELTLGDRKDGTNPFQWMTVHENYPFSKTYDPSLPRLMRIRELQHSLTMADQPGQPRKMQKQQLMP